MNVLYLSKLMTWDLRKLRKVLMPFFKILWWRLRGKKCKGLPPWNFEGIGDINTIYLL